jgi:pantoate--beta-alanine ligase
MEIIKKIANLRKRMEGANGVGLVPTMGALHEGHLSLVRISKSENAVTVCSIFVNPIQFNNATDFEKYPKTLDSDIQLLENENCDILFLPDAEEMYPQKTELVIDFGYQNTVMEGKFRSGHFSGVGIVLSKFFNIVQPDRAYFGQKDFQQCLVVNQLVRELSLPIDIKIIDTLREADGLAMSSRNKRLSDEARKIAPKIYQTLKFAELQSKHSPVREIKIKVLEMLSAFELVVPEYLEFVDYNTGRVVNSLEKGRKYGICIAAFVGDVRLIDNLIINA